MKKVLLIAGHGNNYNGTYDPGAVSKFGQEAELNRELVTRITKVLDGVISFDVYDMNKNCYSYSKNGQTPNYAEYDMVLEVHFNAKTNKDESGDGRFTGMGAYVHPSNVAGRELAEKIITTVVSYGFRKWQVCESAGLHNLLKAQKAGVAYLLLETAFIDDGDDMAWYNANQEKVARAIAQVLITEAGGVLPTEQKDLYHRVQVGAFEVWDNAVNFWKEVKKHVSDAFIVKNGKYYKVQVGAYTVKANAETMMKQMQSLGYSDAFITTEKGEAVSVEAPKKSNEEIAREVIKGFWGTGSERKRRLQQAGYDYEEIQKIVNKLL